MREKTAGDRTVDTLATIALILLFLGGILMVCFLCAPRVEAADGMYALGTIRDHYLRFETDLPVVDAVIVKMSYYGKPGVFVVSTAWPAPDTGIDFGGRLYLTPGYYEPGNLGCHRTAASALVCVPTLPALPAAWYSVMLGHRDQDGSLQWDTGWIPEGNRMECCPSGDYHPSGRDQCEIVAAAADLHSSLYRGTWEMGIYRTPTKDGDRVSENLVDGTKCYGVGRCAGAYAWCVPGP